MTSSDANPTKAQISAIVDDYVREAVSDYVGLWQICIRVRNDFKIEDKDQIRHITLNIIEEMLDRGLEAVNLASAGSGRLPWADQDHHSVINRISSEWRALGREPSVGDIVWFDNTDTGTRV
jgi:hypothetical protein